MPMGSALVDGGILFFAWAVGLYIAQSRTWQFVAIASAATAVWIVLLALDVSGRWPMVPIGITALAAIFPRLFGAGAVTGVEAKADALLEQLDPAKVVDTQTRLSELERIRLLVPDDPGRLVAGRMRLWATARRNDPQVVSSMTPAEYFDRAATRFLRDSQWRRVIGWRTIATAWDEEAALRSFQEETENLIPNEVWWSEPPIVVGEWAAEVQTLIGDLAAAPFRDALADSARTRLIEAAEALLTTAVGDRTDDAKQRQADTADAMRDAWHALGTHVRDLSGGTDTVLEADGREADGSIYDPVNRE